MKLLFYTLETTTRAIVHSTFYIYDESQIIDNSVEVEDVPVPELLPMKSPVLYVNPISKGVWYEYVDRPETEQEKVARLESELSLTQGALNELIILVLGGGE